MRTEQRIEELKRFVEVVHRLGDHGHEAQLARTLSETYTDIQDADAAGIWRERAQALDRVG